MTSSVFIWRGSCVYDTQKGPEVPATDFKGFPKTMHPERSVSSGTEAQKARSAGGVRRPDPVSQERYPILSSRPNPLEDAGIQGECC